MHRTFDPESYVRVLGQEKAYLLASFSGNKNIEKRVIVPGDLIFFVSFLRCIVDNSSSVNSRFYPKL